MDAEVEGRAQISLAFHICLLHHESYLPSAKDVVGKGVPGFPPAGGRRKKMPQTHELRLWSLLGVGGSSVQGCVLLSIPVCSGTDCWKGIKKLPDKLSFC